MIDKGLIKESEKNSSIDDLMLMDDISFAMEEKMTKNKESLASAISKNNKGNKLIRKGGLSQGINVIASNNNMTTFKDELGGLWSTPKGAHAKN